MSGCIDSSISSRLAYHIVYVLAVNPAIKDIDVLTWSILDLRNRLDKFSIFTNPLLLLKISQFVLDNEFVNLLHFFLSRHLYGFLKISLLAFFSSCLQLSLYNRLVVLLCISSFLSLLMEFSVLDIGNTFWLLLTSEVQSGLLDPVIGRSGLELQGLRRFLKDHVVSLMVFKLLFVLQLLNIAL